MRIRFAIWICKRLHAHWSFQSQRRVMFAQGGANGTLLMDFRRMESAIPPSYLLVLLNGTVHSEFGLPRSADPFTLAIPFSGFTSRCGTPGLPDYAHVTSLSFEIRASGYTGGGPDPLNFVMELDRVGIGETVPEPSAMGGFLVAAAAFSCTRFRY